MVHSREVKKAFVVRVEMFSKAVTQSVLGLQAISKTTNAIN